MKKTLLLLLTLAILVALAWALLGRTPSPSVPSESESLPTATQENPIEGEIPDLNPAAKTNPFGGAYKNPFE